MIPRLPYVAVLLAALVGCSTATDESAANKADDVRSPDANQAQTGDKSSPSNLRPITIRVLDADGKPVEGALVGDYVAWEEENIAHGLHGFGESGVDIDGHPTDADGQFVLDEALVEKEFKYGPQPIYAVAPGRKLVGLGSFGPGDGGKTIEVTLQPWCVVDVRVTSKELAELGQKFDLAQGYVYWGEQRPCFFRSSSPSTILRYVLPPGKYDLDVYGRLADGKYPKIEIKPGQRKMALDVDLPASTIARLIGKQAPDVDVASAWRNSKPLSLSDLRGKVVVLEFWGTWCGPCVGSMPKLIEFYREFHDAGLEVVAVHTATDNSPEQFDKRLASASEENWGGRPLPFPVAIDAAKEGKEKPPSYGKITSSYGIHSWPTAVLIDRKGRVVREWNYRGDDAREVILKALATSPRD